MLTALRSQLRRLGAGSPLTPALAYTAVVVVANLLASPLDHTVHPARALLALLMLAAAWVFLFVIITWYRDDDWLAAGFLLVVTLMLGAFVADSVVEIVRDRSVGATLLKVPGMLLAFVVRTVIGAPIAGGIITLARRLTGRGRPGPPRRPARE